MISNKNISKKLLTIWGKITQNMAIVNAFYLSKSLINKVFTYFYGVLLIIGKITPLF